MHNQADLIRRAGKGELLAQEELLKSCQGMVYNLCFRFTGNQQEAEDMAQEALVKVLERLSTFRGDSAFSTWVYRLTINNLRDNWRRNKKVAALRVEINGEDDRQLQLESPEPTPLDEVERKEKQQLLQGALARLPEEQRLVVILRDIRGLSYREIAEALGIEEGTVKSRLSRGRLRLRDILMSEGNFFRK